MRAYLKSICLAALMISGGCANNAPYEKLYSQLESKCPSQGTKRELCLLEAKATVKVEKAHDKQVRTQVRQEDLVKYVANCYESDKVLWYTCRTCSRVELHYMDRARRHGKVYIPRWATRSDFQCISQAQASIAMNRLSRGY